MRQPLVHQRFLAGALGYVQNVQLRGVVDDGIGSQQAVTVPHRVRGQSVGGVAAIELGGVAAIE
jgi:hypothetical protein